MEHVSNCDFCPNKVVSVKVYDAWQVFWHLETVEPNAGSDYLATWCAECGPKHRKAILSA